MPAKKPAPRSAKGKKAATSRPAAKKSAAIRRPHAEPRGREVERAKVAAAHVHKTATAPARASTPAASAPPITPTTTTEAITQMRKAAHSTSHATSPATAGAGKPHDQDSQEDIHVSTAATATRAAVDTDEVEGAEPGSLLAGPRNVQPYIAKRGEQYMSKEQLEHFRHILNSWKRDLMVEVDRTVSHMKDEAANFPDPNDRATQEEEFSLELRTRDRERKLIRKIDEALKRIEDGSYGYCLETGEEIGIKRLEARPVATLSIEAQERRERRERQYGDRDDRYR
ncbi:MAG TPA: RNA polymerase-binding protein DksA [Steroidobacteraceae bacterium]|jgi:DnaK suppressor protein|nr:RNA polymerase-binding protein DksA [Steroidobacteraceae bacterium]